ncbi:tRNA synthetases class II-domain-containing protein [Thamnocephalis sphaerospora]|uniref:tRNA synthetases class II-domain-containing protein n=1 Tax=Thamnocephalis sphaerospora TaxID=78915 RepID=A0A4P9XR54_9FUNG|nr:tRNA synthetases class II-domain-containing protein [Thamnocephalis sphaerospora]|eukprot:RKP08546.1 tRNA synthetases class II-domain-containing protein [Thamnocephalis sphaerospora]
MNRFCTLSRLSTQPGWAARRAAAAILQPGRVHRLHSQSALCRPMGRVGPSTAHVWQTGRRVFSGIASDMHQDIGKEPLFTRRTHECGQLRASDVGQRVVLCGWISHVRQVQMSDKLAFISLRDRMGAVQLVFERQMEDPVSHTSTGMWDALDTLGAEDVLCVTGTVRPRPEGMASKEQSTGQIEVVVDSLERLNAATHLPFTPTSRKLPAEDIRLRYRYIDLRRPALQENLIKRSRIISAARSTLLTEGFLEVETPMLFKSTPEGAREYLVPTRAAGEFFALSQSPQQCKQMLMAAGVDKYFQVAKCFRDEDLRADRQPEFTQLDLELSFVTARQVMELVERVVTAMWRTAYPTSTVVGKPFRVMPFRQAMLQASYSSICGYTMLKYGIDKPDTRFDMRIRQLRGYRPELVTDMLCIKHGAQIVKKDMAAVRAAAGLTGHTKDVEWVRVTADNVQKVRKRCEERLSPGESWDNEGDGQETVTESINVGDLVVYNHRPAKLSGDSTPLGRLRLQAARFLQSKKLLDIDPKRHDFLWVVDFPLFTRDTESGRIQATHHPFTAPVAEDVSMLSSHPDKVRGQHYDLVLNGTEIGGGSIRVHQSDVQRHIMESVLQLTHVETARFEHLLNALASGCPPHGGFAIGLDRMISILCEAPSIRDVIAFPKSAGGKDLTVDCPSTVDAAQLEAVGLAVVPRQL